MHVALIFLYTVSRSACTNLTLVSLLKCSPSAKVASYLCPLTPCLSMPTSTRPSQNRPSHYRRNHSKLTSLEASGFDIHLCWLPGHVGIRGNERADRAAKTARRADMQPGLIPPSDFKPIIRKHITAMWEQTSRNRTQRATHSPSEHPQGSIRF